MKRVVAWLVLFALAGMLAAAPACASGAMVTTALEKENSARVENILLAAWSINQTVLNSGETFSFNAVVGPRTKKQGYLDAVNGRGVVVTGGGVAQTASTLYLALLTLDPSAVRFDALSFYGDRFNQDYVDNGDQAVLVDYSAGTDFRFTNLTAGQLIIEMWLSEDCLCCSVSLTDANEWVGADTATDAAFLSGNSRASLPRSTPVGSARITCGDDGNLLGNVALAADSICDTTLLPGDVFSFNTVVGPREERCGYLPAVNGRGVEVIGGGVGQVAAALWLAVKNLPEVSIVEKSTYGQRYNQAYVESSADAILIDYNAGVDFAFRYTGSSSLTLYTSLEDGTLYCEVYQNE